MHPNMKEILAELEQLRLRSRSDFCAVANRDAGSRFIQWICASGFRNDRFRRLKHTTGEGLAGQVFRIGRPVLVNADPELRTVRSDYPIMLAEQLLAAAAFPILAEGRVRGVLLMGSRSAIAYGQDELDLAERSAEKLAALL